MNSDELDMLFSADARAPASDVPPLYPNFDAQAGTQAQAVGVSPRPIAGLESRTEKQSNGTSAVKEQLVTIHEELEQLRQRRQQLEEKRIRLLAASLPSSRLISNSKLEERSSCNASQTSRTQKNKSLTVKTSPQHSTTMAASRSSNPSNSRTSSATRRHPFAASNAAHRSGNDVFIPSENTRRLNLQEDPYFQLKEAMKKAAEEDTMCMIGTFLLEDNSKVYTFGRERRFRPLVGQNGKYYLSTDVEVDQSSNHRQQRSRSADVVRRTYTGTPGPGAYTPRYGKLSKPSIRTLYQ